MADWAFEAFANAHPHEAYAEWPERFWEFYHRKCPSVGRKQMEKLLKESK